ncbi:Hypothetical predicted protein [Olea europaea subsp. europaea]|uniref:Uncharacterized protein n=1 Tax=Olea europaea subsp. europaea TaxID=158383 RepID=A0A8S0U1F5_OLEEU|nr:Hypothetical predicted protein [Olea europaea subsp. europaea]
MEFELGRDKYIDDDGTTALKTSGIDMAKLGGGRLLIPLSGTYVVDGEQAREEGVIEERDDRKRTKYRRKYEELQEESRDHGIADVVMTLSDIEVKGNVEELGNIRDCTSDSEKRAQWHERKTLQKMTVFEQPKILIKDLKVDNGWNERLVEEPVHQAGEVLIKLGKIETGKDRLIWTESLDGNFSKKCLGSYKMSWADITVA